jgi:hypothetical protein
VSVCFVLDQKGMAPSTALDRAVKAVLTDEFDKYKDDDLDRVVAEILIREAREKNEGRREEVPLEQR